MGEAEARSELQAKAHANIVILDGVLGWGNRKSGYEAYGPDGRWGGGAHGDLLGDALERAGAHEGAGLVVVAVPRFGDDEAVSAVVRAAVEAFQRGEQPNGS